MAAATLKHLCCGLVMATVMASPVPDRDHRRQILDARWRHHSSIQAHQISSSINYTTRIDPASRFGEWEGWGTSLAWWAVAFGDRGDVADAIFTMNQTVHVSTQAGNTTVPGLGLTIARYNIGASSTVAAGGEHMVVSPHMIPERAVDALFLTWEHNNTYDWARDANQRAMLSMAHARGASKLQLFSNSPVWFQLANHNPSGADDGSRDNLDLSNHKQFAQMMAEVAAHFSHQEGQHFASVEAFNEPISTWWRSTGTQEGCHFEVGTQKSVLLALRGALDAAGLKETMIASSDENTYTEAISTWAGLGDSARGVVDQVNVHGYEYGGGRRDELYAAVSKAGKRLWNSEYGEGDATGLQMATNLNLDLQWLHPTAWVYWQVLDGGGWGLMAVDEPNKKIENVNLKYYVLAQYSRHIRPGFEIVSSGEDRNTVAAISSDGVLVMVTTNYGDAQWVTYDLSGFVYGGGGVDRWRTETGGGDEYEHYSDGFVWGEGNQTLVAYFEPDSVQTFEIRGILPRQ